MWQRGIRTSSLPGLRRLYSSHNAGDRQTTLIDLAKLYEAKKPITVVTAHDYITARIADASEDLDAVLIGDSLAMVSKGYPSTLEIPFEEYYYTCQSVLRGIENKFVIADLPYGSFETGLTQCLESAIKLMKLGKIGSLKIEGSFEYSKEIQRLVEIGIPVTGHIGLKPQRLNAMGGYKVQGKTHSQALSIYQEALHLQKLGISMLVLECVPHKLANYITENLSIPTIGIGAGSGTSGQVLVQADLLGMLDNDNAKFAKKYANFYNQGVSAVNEYAGDVKTGTFPKNKEHGYHMKDEEFEQFLDEAKSIQ